MTRVVLSPNRTPRGMVARPRAVVIHSTRSGRSDFSDEQELAATLSWFSSPSAQASAHWVISAAEAVRVVADEDAAWHAGWHNPYAWGIELTQPVASQPYSEGHYQKLAAVCRGYVARGVPAVYLGDFTNSEAGFVGHEKTRQGRDAGKSDPGRAFDWALFLSLLQPEILKEDAMANAVEIADYLYGIKKKRDREARTGVKETTTEEEHVYAAYLGIFANLFQDFLRTANRGAKDAIRDTHGPHGGGGTALELPVGARFERVE